jgi:hypothetical protein
VLYKKKLKNSWNIYVDGVDLVWVDWPSLILFWQLKELNYWLGGAAVVVVVVVVVT